MARKSKGNVRAVERWNELFDILSDNRRRMILFSLLNESGGHRLPLPEAAVHSTDTVDTEAVCLNLRHQHLPKLAEEGLVRWERDPLCVQRGPHFEEAAFLLRWITESPDEVPSRLVSDCRILGDQE